MWQKWYIFVTLVLFVVSLVPPVPWYNVKFDIKMGNETNTPTFSRRGVWKHWYTDTDGSSKTANLIGNHENDFCGQDHRDVYGDTCCHSFQANQAFAVMAGAFALILCFTLFFEQPTQNWMWRPWMSVLASLICSAISIGIVFGVFRNKPFCGKIKGSLKIDTENETTTIWYGLVLFMVATAMMPLYLALEKIFPEAGTSTSESSITQKVGSLTF
jgi:hypothetical protein